MSEFTKDEKYFEKLLPKSSNFQKPEASSASNAGILYYKCLSEGLEKKINELQKRVEKAISTRNVQKQNITDMINRKNHLLSEFHEQFRKYSRKTKYENIIEDEVEQLVKFLDELIQLHNEINYVKTSENNIRNYAVAKFQIVCSELQLVKEAYEKNVEQMKRTLKELKEWEIEWETLEKWVPDINHSIRLRQEKISHLKWSIKNKIADCEMLKNEGERIQAQTDVEILKAQQILKNDAVKVQQAFYSMKNRFSELKSNLLNIDEMKRQLTNYNERLLKNMKLVGEMETDIQEEKFKLEELQKKIEIDLNNLRVLEDEKKLQIEKQGELGNSLHEYREKIGDGETLLKNFSEEELLIEEKQKEIAMEIETRNGKITLLETQNKNYLEEKARNEALKKEVDGLKRENAVARKRLFELNIEDEVKKKKINELENTLLSKNISVYDNASDQEFLHSVLNVEKELNVTSESIDDEVDVLFDNICEQRSQIQCLEKHFEELSAEGRSFDQELRRKEELLQETKNSVQMVDASIFALKQNVYQKNYVTQQDLNKQLTTLSNHVESERSVVEKLKGEIADLTKKRLLFTPENKRTSGLKKKKVENRGVVNEKNESSNSDIYSFK